MVRNCIMALLAAVYLFSAKITARDRIHITHAYANTNAQSLIGLPMGSHKTIVDMAGNLHWSQWSLKRRGLDVPIGFSAQMDGMLAIQVLGNGSPLKVIGQHLYYNRFPFVVTRLAGDGFSVEELAFSTEATGHGLDVVRVRLENTDRSSTSVEVRLSGKRHNLPAFAGRTTLATRDGFLVTLAQAQSGAFSALKGNLLLDFTTDVPAHSTATLWLKRPYSLLAKDRASIAAVSGADLLKQSVQSWEAFWAAGAGDPGFLRLLPGLCRDPHGTRSGRRFVVARRARSLPAILGTGRILSGPGIGCLRASGYCQSHRRTRLLTPIR
jgi:hypothetical protein